MLLLHQVRSYYLYRPSTDMRKSFDGLCGLISGQLGKNPLNGDLFIFFNKRRNQVKLLHWQGDGFVIYYKRLERGTYELPRFDDNSLESLLTVQNLMLILEGISLVSVRKRRRYQQIPARGCS